MNISDVSIAKATGPLRKQPSVPPSSLLPQFSSSNDEQAAIVDLNLGSLSSSQSLEESSANKTKATLTYEQALYEQIGRRDLAIRLYEQAHLVEGVRHSAHVNFEHKQGTKSKILTIDLESSVEIAAAYDPVRSAAQGDYAAALAFTQRQQFSMLASQSPLSSDSVDTKIVHQEHGTVEKKNNSMSLIPNIQRNDDIQSTLTSELESIRRESEAEVKSDYIDSEGAENSTVPINSLEPSLSKIDIPTEEHETARQVLERIFLAFKPQKQQPVFSRYVDPEQSIGDGSLDLRV